MAIKLNIKFLVHKFCLWLNTFPVINETNDVGMYINWMTRLCVIITSRWMFNDTEDDDNEDDDDDFPLKKLGWILCEPITQY